MNGDAENELEGGGDVPAPVDPPAPADAPASEAREPAFPRKPFSNWGAAKKEEPGLLQRTSQKLKSIFSRKKAENETEPEPELETEAGLELQEDVELVGGVQDLPLLETAAGEPEPEIVSAQPDVPELIEAEAASESPKEDLKFLWSASDEPAAEPEAVAGLDEALPMDEPAAEVPVEAPHESAQEVPLADVPKPDPKKKGFFARLLARKKAEPPQTPPEMDIADLAPDAVTAEVVPDTGAHLDAADEAFAAAQDSFAPPPATDPAFASVEDALPLEEAPPAEAPMVFEAPMAFEATEPVDETQPIDVPLPGAPVGAESAASYHAMPVYDFDAPAAKADDRSTMEVEQPAAEAIDARPTAEVTSVGDISPVPEVATHAEEVERDTDEFDAIDLSETIAEDPEKTGEIPRGPGFFKKLFTRTKEVTQVEPAVLPPPTANPTFLVTKFRTFYNEVVIYKSQKTDLTAGFATAIVTSYDADLSPEQAAQSLSQRLHQMLELQLAEASWMGGEAHDLYPEAQYAMACLADEMLTYLEWPGQAAWGAHHLELKLFKTAAADVDFFKRVDKLLKNGPQTVGTRDLARVYLLAIASGFKGKYRPFGLQRPLAEYRRRLYEFVYDGDALLLYADDRRIFPEATSATVVGKGVKRFSMAQQWAAILILLLAGYTWISHMAWTRVSADLKDIAARVEQARTSTTNTTDTPNGGGGR